MWWNFPKKLMNKGAGYNASAGNLLTFVSLSGEQFMFLPREEESQLFRAQICLSFLVGVKI